MTANILCHASSTWTTRHRLRGGVLKGARCICPYAAAELLALPLGLATLAEAVSPTSTRTTPRHCPDSPWHRAQLGVHLDNEQMSFNRTGQLQRPRLTWMASVVCRPLSLTNQLLRKSLLSRNFTLQNWPETHPLAPKSSHAFFEASCHSSAQECARSAWRKAEDSTTNPPSYLSHANCRGGSPTIPPHAHCTHCARTARHSMHKHPVRGLLGHS